MAYYLSKKNEKKTVIVHKDIIRVSTQIWMLDIVGIFLVIRIGNFLIPVFPHDGGFLSCIICSTSVAFRISNRKLVHAINLVLYCKKTRIMFRPLIVMVMIFTRLGTRMDYSGYEWWKKNCLTNLDFILTGISSLLVLLVFFWDWFRLIE